MMVAGDFPPKRKRSYEAYLAGIASRSIDLRCFYLTARSIVRALCEQKTRIADWTGTLSLE